MRIIVTGSREFDREDVVAAFLDGLAEQCLAIGDRELTIVHGHCRKGPDRFADDWCEAVAGHFDNLGFQVVADRYPAKWSLCARSCPTGPRHRKRRPDGATYCPTAGHRRNARMASLGADACVAFHRDNSSGTRNMIDEAEQAGIRVETVLFEDLAPAGASA